MKLRRIELAFVERTARVSRLMNLPQVAKRVKLIGKLGVMMREEEEKEMEISSQVIDEKTPSSSMRGKVPADPSRRSNRSSQ